MKFRVLGHRKSDAHRVTVEFEAESKASAERDAIKQGLQVIRVEIVPATGDPPGKSAQRPNNHRARAPESEPTRSGGTSRLLMLVLVLVVAAAAAYWSWDAIKPFIPGLH